MASIIPEVSIQWLCLLLCSKGFNYWKDLIIVLLHQNGFGTQGGPQDACIHVGF